MNGNSLTLTPFGWPVVLYMTLAGVAAGGALVGAWMLLRGGAEERRTASRGLLLAAVSIALGSLFLIADLEAPGRMWLVLIHFNPASIISWGVRIITLFGLLTGWTWWALSRTPEAREGLPGHLKVAVAAVAVLALAVGLYPAWVLYQATARPLWSSPLIAPLFLVSAAHTGLAALLLGRILGKTEREPAPSSRGEAHGRRWLEVALIASQAVLLTLYLLTATRGYEAAAARIVSGDLAGWLWGGVVVAGWLLPLLLLTTPGAGRARLAFGACGVLFGGLALRALIVLGGQGFDSMISTLQATGRILHG